MKNLGLQIATLSGKIDGSGGAGAPLGMGGGAAAAAAAAGIDGGGGPFGGGAGGGGPFGKNPLLVILLLKFVFGKNHFVSLWWSS